MTPPSGPEYDANDDPPSPLLDRVFPRDQCVRVPGGAVYMNSGPHNFSTSAHYGPLAGFYVPAPDRSIALG